MPMNNDLIRKLRTQGRRLGRTEAKAGPLYLEGQGSTPEWTPAFAGTGTAGTFTYSVQVGYYTRIGRLVFIQFFVSISAIGTPPTTNMVITGLPITPSSATNSHHGVAFTTISNFNYTNTAFELTGRIPPSDPRIFLFESFDNAVTVNAPAANFTNAACDLRGIGFYMV